MQRSTRGSKNSNPVLVTPTQATMKSFQISEYFLCPDCENLLRLRGEEWVLDIGFRGASTFPLQAALSKAEPLAVLSQLSIIDGKPAAGIDLDQLIYFAVSVYWRAGARKWDALDHSAQ